MTEPLHALSYFSRNTVDETGGRLPVEIGQILAAARRNNRQGDVTGALLFSGGCFAQVLEGPLGAVERIFERIQCDPRHRDVTVLSFEPIETRAFPHWSMAFAGLPDDAAPQLTEGVLAHPAGLPDSEAGHDLIHVLQGLIARHDAAGPG